MTSLSPFYATTRDQLSRSPLGLYLLAALRSKYRHQWIRSDTDLVIEGFPGSANSFAVAAFLYAQPSLVRISSHLHSSAQVIRATSRNLPTLVLLREPPACVASLFSRRSDQYPGIAHALRAYSRFYKALLPLRARFVLATYHEVVTDFGTVINRINTRFGTTFALFQHNSANVKACMRGIIQARPQDNRKELKRHVMRQLASPHYVTLLTEAWAIYNRYEHHS